MDQDVLLHQLGEDLTRLHRLIVRFARGERHLKQERDQLQGAVDIKFALVCGGYGGPHERTADPQVL